MKIVIFLILREFSSLERVEVNESYTCNRILMNSFKLHGMNNPMIHNKPDICPYVE